MIRIPFMPIGTTSPSAVYHIFMNDEACSVAELLGNPSTLLDYYLRLDDLSCCSVLGGFVISADDKIAMGETDEISMSQTWLPAIIRLQRGEESVSVWPWEESSMTLTRKGPLIEMEDVHHSGTVVCAKVRFPFHDFVRAMLDASRPMALFVAEFHSTIDGYRSNPFYNQDEEAIDRLQFLREEFSPDWPNWITESEVLLANTAK